MSTRTDPRVPYPTLVLSAGSEANQPGFHRLDSSDFEKLDSFRQPKYDPDSLNRRLERVAFPEKLDAFLKAEGAVAWVRESKRDGKLVHGEGYNYRAGHTLTLPGIEQIGRAHV